MPPREFRPQMLSFRQLRVRAARLLLRGHDDDIAEVELIIQHIRDRKEMPGPELTHPPRLRLVRPDPAT
jgi:hypothetical protein